MDFNTNYEVPMEEIQEETNDFEKYCSEMSGKDVEGRPLATIAYQCYAMEDDENSPSKTVQFKLTTPWVQIWTDKFHPGYVGMDIAFRSFDDTELRLLWGRMNRHLRNMSKEPEKTWVLYFRILDNASLSEGKEEIVMAHVINPSIFFLTREAPTMEAENIDGEFGLQGGNIVRMLIPEDLVSIEISPNEKYDLNTIRAEVQRDIAEAEYLNASAMAGDNWNEDSTNF